MESADGGSAAAVVVDPWTDGNFPIPGIIYGVYTLTDAQLLGFSVERLLTAGRMSF